jgi:hypothetical protein
MFSQPSANAAKPAVIFRSGKFPEPVLSRHIPPLAVHDFITKIPVKGYRVLYT